MRLYFLPNRVAIGVDCGPIPLVVYATSTGPHLAPRERWLMGKPVLSEYEFEVPHGQLMRVVNASWGSNGKWEWLVFCLAAVLRWFGLRMRFQTPHAVLGPEFVGRVMGWEDAEGMTAGDLKAKVKADPERFRKC